MPRRSILSAAERESLLVLPDSKDDLIRHYTLLLRPHEVSSGGIFDAGILKVAHHPLG